MSAQDKIKMELKQTPKLKAAAVQVKIGCIDGYKLDYDFKSNVKEAKRPASPEETIVSAARELGRLAALYDGNGQQVIDAVTEAVASVNKWKKENGYAVIIAHVKP